LYAVVRLLFAPIATASSTCVCPRTCGAPVTEEPGLRPKSPNIVVGPVLVTVEPPSTEKLAAVPRPTVAGAPKALLANRRVESSPRNKSPTRNALPRARKRERGLTARESLRRDSCIGGTPLFMGVS
jgi:hypothetical protein